MYSMAMISNLPMIMFVISISFEIGSSASEVMPVLIRVVGSAETDSNMPSSKLLPVRWLRT